MKRLGSSGRDGRSRSELRALGSFYTSRELASLLSAWCIDSAACPTVIDPTFGGCAFLEAAVDRLESLGSACAGRRVFGVDIDPRTAGYANALRQRGVPPENLVNADFLRLEPNHFGHQFGALVGNPPYVRHHLLDVATVERGQKRARELGVGLPRTADLWAYVLVHSLQFLAPGARMALLLPGSVLQADYSRPVVAELAASFASLDLILVRDRLFEDASERSVVLLADGYQRGPTAPRRHKVRSVEELSGFLESSLVQDPPLEDCSLEWNDRSALVAASNPADRLAAEFFQECVSEAADSLGSISTVRIGTVTGANKFFVRPPSEVEASVQSRAIVTRSSWLLSPIWRTEDQDDREAADDRTRLLMIPPDGWVGSKLLNWIADAEGQQIHEGHHCRNRTPWYSLPEPDVHAALMPYMGVSAPRIVVNGAGASSTNAIHGLDWNRPSCGPRAVLSSWTTFHGLAVELFGRTYGKGVLKVEPSDVRSLPVLRLGSSRGLAELDRVARAEGRESAIGVADRLALAEQLGLTTAEIRLLRDWQASLQSFRLRKR